MGKKFQWRKNRDIDHAPELLEDCLEGKFADSGAHRIDRNGFNTFSVDTTYGEMVGSHYEAPEKGFDNKAVCLRPGTSSNRFFMHDLALYLRNQLQCHAFILDINGQGESGGVYNFSHFGQSSVEADRAIVEHFGLKRFGALGNSAGGSAVAHAAAIDSSVYSGGVIMTGAPTHPLHVLNNRFYGELLKMTKVFRFAHSLPRPVYEGGDWLVSRFLKLHHEELRPDDYDGMVFGAMRLEGEDPVSGEPFTLSTMMDSMYEAPMTKDEARKITCPSLWVWGGSDGLLNNIRGVQDYDGLPQRFKDLLISAGAANWDDFWDDERVHLGEGQNRSAFYKVYRRVDHSLEEKTKMGKDVSFAKDANHPQVRQDFANFFHWYMD